MTEYFIRATSFAAPFFSDESTGFIEAESPRVALEAFAAAYKHPCGLYAANCYANSDAFHKGQKPLAQWLCNHEQAKRKAEQKGSCTYRGNGPGDFEIDGKRHIVDNPKDESVVS